MNTTTLSVKSPAFSEGGMIPMDHSARGKDLSPELLLDGIDVHAQSIAITMDDLSHPLFPGYNHWLVWNLPIMTKINAAMARGTFLKDLNAYQGLAYGHHRYKGPKPPGKSIHTYCFTVYTLDIKLDLSHNTRKRALLAAMEGHILQTATLCGKFQNPTKKH